MHWRARKLDLVPQTNLKKFYFSQLQTSRARINLSHMLRLFRKKDLKPRLLVVYASDDAQYALRTINELAPLELRGSLRDILRKNRLCKTAVTEIQPFRWKKFRQLWPIPGKGNLKLRKTHFWQWREVRNHGSWTQIEASGLPPHQQDWKSSCYAIWSD